MHFTYADTVEALSLAFTGQLCNNATVQPAWARFFQCLQKNNMEHTKETIEILNDLIEINNDRIKGYTRAIEELKDGDEDVKVLFENMIDQSREARTHSGKRCRCLARTWRPEQQTAGRSTKCGWISK